MNGNDKDLAYEEKIDKVTEQIEELVLDAMLSALRKIQQRNLTFKDSSNRTGSQHIVF